MTTTMCPVCRSPAGDGKHVGDNTQFECPNCGGYRLAGTVLALIERGTQNKLPTPQAFKELVAKRRGNSKEYPVITSYDLGWV